MVLICYNLQGAFSVAHVVLLVEFQNALHICLAPKETAGCNSIMSGWTYVTLPNIQTHSADSVPVGSSKGRYLHWTALVDVLRLQVQHWRRAADRQTPSILHITRFAEVSQMQRRRIKGTQATSIITTI
jgi:hypothetical protein